MKTKQKTFLDVYNETIAPKLMAIDLLLKTETNQLDLAKVSAALSLPDDEVIQIMRQEEISVLNSQTFFLIMKQGSSEICRLFNRELRCGTPNTYTPADISYIYNIDIELIFDACKKIGLSSFDSITIPLLFANLSASSTV